MLQRLRLCRTSDTVFRREIDSRRQWGYGTCYGGSFPAAKECREDWEGVMGRRRRGRGEEGARGGGISQMDLIKCLGGHMECLDGMRLQSFLTLFTRATPGTPASSI